MVKLPKSSPISTLNYPVKALEIYEQDTDLLNGYRDYIHRITAS